MPLNKVVNTPPPVSYELRVARSDNGTATMSLVQLGGLNNGAVVATASRAGWDDATPWTAGTYIADVHTNRFGFPCWELNNNDANGISGRVGIQLHAAQAASAGNPISWGSTGCLVADAGFLNTVKGLTGSSPLKIVVSNNVGVTENVQLAVSATSTSVSEGGRFAINVSLNDALSKDVWAHVEQVSGSQTTASGANADYKFVKGSVPGQVEEFFSGRSDQINGGNAFTDGWYVKIPAGRTSAQFVLDALVDNQAEGSELARFRVVDYAINSPGTNKLQRLYSDSVSPNKLLIKNGGPSTVDVFINDGGGEIHESGSSFGFRGVLQAAPGTLINWDFQAYGIPDGLVIRDSKGNTYGTAGLVPNFHTGSFTVAAGTSGTLNVVVNGNVDPNTAWVLNVAPAGAAAGFAAAMAGMSEAEVAAVASADIFAPAATVGSISAGQRLAVAFDPSIPGVLTANVTAGKMYIVSVQRYTADVVDPYLSISSPSTPVPLTFDDTATNQNAVAYITSSTTETITLSISDAANRGGGVAVYFNEVTEEQRKAFAINVNTGIIEEASGAEPLGVSFTVVRTGDISQAASVAWRVAQDGSNPVDASDFGGLVPGGTINFAANQRNSGGEVFALADGIAEQIEGFRIELYNPVGAVLATNEVHGQSAFASVLVTDSFFAPIIDYGTPFDDDIYGGPRVDQLSGGDGWDVIRFSAEDAVVAGGDGIDTARNTGTSGVTFDLGARGFEFYYGNNAGETIFTTGVAQLGIDAGGGNDDITGSVFGDNITGGAGNDAIRGLGGNDVLGGAGGDDVIDGYDGDDVIFGEAGVDRMRGSGGSDTIYYDPSDAEISGGDGYDTARATTNDGLAIRLDSWSVEQLFAGGGNDLIFTFGTAAYSVDAGAGNDTVSGNTFGDTLAGNNGNDVLDGLGGNDTLGGGQGSDRLMGGLGADLLFGEGDPDSFIYRGINDAGDTILGFETRALRGANNDKIEIWRSGFMQPGDAALGALDPLRFVAGPANQAFGQFLFDTNNGRLYWDGDGTGAQQTATHLLTVQGVNNLSALDIVLV